MSEAVITVSERTYEAFKRAEAIEREIVEVIKRHVKELKEKNWDVWEINDILEIVFDDLAFDIDKILMDE